MSYVWNAEGSAYLFPTCYRTENRALILRATLLFALAAALFWLSLGEPEPAQGGAALLRLNARPGSPEPHFYAGALLLLVGLIDLVFATRQRQLKLLAGQPAPLVLPLPHHATGVSPGAGWLFNMLRQGRILPAGLSGRYQRALRRVLPGAEFAPTALQSYARVRIANLVFTAGLLIALALAWAAASTRAAWPLAALLLGTLAVAQVTYSAWIAHDAPGPIALMLALALAFAATLGLAWFGASVPHLGRLQPYELPRAVAVMLGCLMLIDLLALMAARAQMNADGATVDASASGVEVVLPVDASRLMVDVDRELLRRCTDGVPNRRYLRLTPQEAAAAGETVVALEETQPTLPAAHRDALPVPPMTQRAWLLAMAALALLFTGVAGVLWVVMAHALLANAASSWANAATALALLIAGGYAARAGHLAWSRVDVESTLFEVEIGTSAHARPRGGGEEAGTRLHVRAFRMQSSFYAAGEHLLGSRSLRAFYADHRLAVDVVKQVEEMSARSATAVPGRSRGGAEPVVESRPPASRSKLPPRYCSACGTPLLQGAQFCQQCGNQVAG